MNLRTYSIPCFALALASASGCIAGDGTSSENIETMEEALYFRNDTTLWNGASSSNPGPLGTGVAIPVCFIDAPRSALNGGDRNTCDHATATRDCTGDFYTTADDFGRPPNFPGATSAAVRDKIREYIRTNIERTWMKESNLEFYGWGACPKVNGVHRTQDLLPYISVQLSGMALPEGQTCSDNDDCDYGQHCNASDKCQADKTNWTNFLGKTTLPTIVFLDWKAIQYEPLLNLFNIVHEFGHALGFGHEWNRPDWTIPGGEHEGNFPGNYLGTPANETWSTMDYSDGSQLPDGQISSWDIAGVQAAYGRKYKGSLVGDLGHCANIEGASIANGARIVGYPCRGQWNDTFWRPSDSVHFEATANNRCLNISGSVGANPLISWDCNDGANEDFVFSSVEWRGMGNMCVHRNGNNLELRNCNGSASQRWDFYSEGGNPAFRIKAAGGATCVQGQTTDGAMGEQLQMATCSTSTRQRFIFPTNGVIRYRNNSELCANVSGGLPVSGSPIVLWNGCGSNATFNSRFHVRGRVKSNSANYCMEFKGRNAQVEMETCDSTDPKQIWEYYF